MTMISRPLRPHLDVAISWHIDGLLRDMCRREQIDLAEAVCRLIEIGDLVQRAISSGKNVVVQDGPKNLPVLLLKPPRKWKALP